MTRPALLITALIFSISSYSQTVPEADKTPSFSRNEVVAGYGILPSPQVFSGSLFSPTAYENKSVTGAPFITYRYYGSRVVSIGVTVVYEHEDGAWRHVNHSRAAVVIDANGTFSRTSITVAPEVTLSYYTSRNDIFRLYAVTSLGYMHRDQAATTTYSNNSSASFPSYDIPPHPWANRPALYIAPFGIRIGGKVAVFAEMGIGYRGLFNGGLTCRF